MAAHPLIVLRVHLSDVLGYAQLFAYLAAGGSALFAVFTYRRGVRLERAKWLMALYEKFYERSDLKMARDLLDSKSDEVLTMIREEAAAPTT
jgi:hypothetical protein